MLRKEPHHNYIVYPSWAVTSYKWNDLPRLFDDPLNSGYLEPGRDLEFYYRYGYPRTPQPFELIDGPVGGGIIMWEGDARAGHGHGWLPYNILRNEANILIPLGMNVLNASIGTSSVPFDSQVSYIEPWGELGWEIGIGKRAKSYRCAVTTEHIECCGVDLYWVITIKSGQRSIKGLDEMSTWGRGFGLDVKPINEAPEEILAEAASWLVVPGYENAWFSVSGGGDSVSRHFAFVVYIAYHLRWKAGPRVCSMHLLADIEGKPNARRLWTSAPWQRRK